MVWKTPEWVLGCTNIELHMGSLKNVRLGSCENSVGSVWPWLAESLEIMIRDFSHKAFIDPWIGVLAFKLDGENNEKNVGTCPCQACEWGLLQLPRMRGLR